MQHCIGYFQEIHLVSLVTQHLNILISLFPYPSFCYGLWLLLVSTDRMRRTAHHPHSSPAVNVAHTQPAVQGEGEYSVTLQDIYHLSSVNDDCVHSGFAMIT